jgi:hypothetical protein
MLVFAGFRPVHRARRNLSARLLVTAIIVGMVAVPLSFHTRTVYANNELRSVVAEAIQEWDATVKATFVDARVVDGTAQVELRMSGPNEPLPTWRLAEMISGQFGGEIELVVLYDQIQQFEVSSG